MNENEQKLKEIFAVLKGEGSFALACHQQADADGFGSALALHLWLRQQNKKSVIFFQDDSYQEFSFLPGVNEMVRKGEILSARMCKNVQECAKTISDNFLPKIAIGLDYGNLDRLAFPAEIKTGIAKKEIYFITVDHHLRYNQKGDILLVDEKASSTCEIIADFFYLNNIAFKKEVAICLLAGIVSDTGNFRHVSTTSKTLEVASRLLSKGVIMKKIIKQVAQKDPKNATRALAIAFECLKINQEFKFAHIQLDRQTIEKYNISRESLTGLASILANVPEINFSLTLFEWESSKTKASLRSEKDYDVASLANLFGGGGHLVAAGFETDKTPRDTYRDFIKKIKQKNFDKPKAG